MSLSHTRLRPRLQDAVIFSLLCGPQNFQEIVYFTETQFAVDIIAFRSKRLEQSVRNFWRACFGDILTKIMFNLQIMTQVHFAVLLKLAHIITFTIRNERDAFHPQGTDF